MIRIFSGGLGSGKTLSAIRVMKLRNQHTFVNQDIKLKKCIRLKISDIVREVIVPPPEGSRKSPETKLEVAWDFWKEQTDKYKKDGGYDIFLDEIGQFLSARGSMTGFSKKAMQWVAQIRKILGQSELHDILLVNQKVDGIDVDLRDFALEITHCNKYYTIGGQLVPATNQNVHLAQLMPTKVWSDGKLITKDIPKTTIVQHIFTGEYCTNNYFAFRFQKKKTYDKKSFFVGNQYMQHYNSYEVLDFSPSTFL